MYTKQITTKSGYKTNIDRYIVLRNGRRHTTVWGKTKAQQAAKAISSTLFLQNNDKIEILNENTGEILRFQ